MCELKKSGKAWVPGDIRKEYAAAGEQRELLEIALLEAIQQLGEEQSKKHAAVKAAFLNRITHVKERMVLREEEVTGRWLTEERMRTELKWSKETIRQVVAYCRKFPNTLVRHMTLSCFSFLVA
ncbi:unnamed protein product [Symbiodinium natans]|uniref:Uncharacterized protein n=1 Tax=Symbiodinium natans TaxID=878477 RepID=A0A812TVL1_9DINO|nr:unnamed protein product [Symbiodinium natans]